MRTTKEEEGRRKRPAEKEAARHNHEDHMLRDVLIRAAAILMMAGTAVPAAAANPQRTDHGQVSLQRRVLGEWVTEEGKARVRIELCGDRYCGRIVWLKEPEKNGAPVRDDKNPDHSLREQPVLGLRIISDFNYDGEGVWSGGTVYDPESGNDYRGKMTLADDRTLELRGYVLIPLFGRSETWTRWEGK
jgi:uncharacterized protein (DUF2147 family)